MRPVRERDVQDATVEALRLAGFEVLHTSAWRQRGPSGVARGVPDLLVTHSEAPVACWCGIEMKRPKSPLSPAQRDLHERDRIYVARSASEALGYAVAWLITVVPGCPQGLRRATAVLDEMSPADTEASNG